MNDVEAVTRLLADSRTELRVALFIALQNSNIEIVRPFLQHPGIYDAGGRGGQGVQEPWSDILTFAIGSSTLDVVKLVLNDPRIGPKMTGDISCIVLYSAIDWGRLEVVELLLKDHRFDPSYHWTNGTGHTLFDRVIEKEAKPEIIRLLIRDTRFDVKSEDYLLHKAVRKGRLTTVSELMSSGRFRQILGVKDGNGQTALELAQSLPGLEDIVKLLEETGAGSR